MTEKNALTLGFVGFVSSPRARNHSFSVFFFSYCLCAPTQPDAGKRVKNLSRARAQPTKPTKPPRPRGAH
jgi:hypothetical protein